jgi:hypothetical protein
MARLLMGMSQDVVVCHSCPSASPRPRSVMNATVLHTDWKFRFLQEVDLDSMQERFSSLLDRCHSRHLLSSGLIKWHGTVR